MKKNIMMRLASILLIAVLMSTCAISGTFAKYVTEQGGTASARVAKWSFKVGDTEDITEEEFTFDLGQTITEIGEDAEDSDVAKDNGDLLLAPGTQGSFEIVLENTSEVTAQYKVEFDKSTMPANFTYTYTVGVRTVGDDVDEETAQKNEQALATFTRIDMNKQVTITVNWTWPFDGDPSSDNQYAEQYAETGLTMGVTVTVEQVD